MLLFMCPLPDREDLSKQREENKAGDRIRHEQEKQLQSNAVRLSTLEQQVADGKEMSVQLTQLVESANSQKSGMEEQMRMMRTANNSLQDKVRCNLSHLHRTLSAFDARCKHPFAR